MVASRKHWNCLGSAAGAAAGLWLCASSPADASSIASVDEASASVSERPRAEAVLAEARVAQVSFAQVPSARAPSAQASSEPAARWQPVWGVAEDGSVDLGRLHRDSPQERPADVAAEVLRHGIRYERPMSMIDVPLSVGVRAPGRGRSLVTLEVRF